MLRDGVQLQIRYRALQDKKQDSNVAHACGNRLGEGLVQQEVGRTMSARQDLARILISIPRVTRWSSRYLRG